jgi:hypothetical protein
MNPETLNLLKTLAEKLGVALSDLLKIYAQRCIVDGCYELALSLVWIAAFVWIARSLNPWFITIKANPEYRHDHLTLNLLQCAAWTLSVVLLLVPASIMLSYAVSNLFAPQACAINAILEKVK